MGNQIPLPALNMTDVHQPKIERYIVEAVVGHKPGRGRKSQHNYKYRLRLKGYGPESDLVYRADEVPQCHELISAYRSQHGLSVAPAKQQSSPLPIQPLKRKRNEGSVQSTNKRARAQPTSKTSGSGQSKRVKSKRTQRKSERKRKANKKYTSNVYKR